MDDDDFICDFCAETVPETEVNDCQPDDDGFCIRCGKPIEDPRHDR